MAKTRKSIKYRKSIKTRKSKGSRKIRKGGRQDECSICFEELDENAKDNSKIVFETKCHHRFHKGCLSKHCESKSTCPLCRGDIKKDCMKTKVLDNSEIDAIVKEIISDDNTSFKKNIPLKTHWANCVRNKIKDMVYDADYVYKYGYASKDDDLYKQALDTAQWFFNEEDCPP